MMGGDNCLDEPPQMLPPPPGTFVDREELIQHVGDFAVSQGYVVTIKQSKRDKFVILGCDRGGVYRNRRKPADDSSGEQNSRKRKMASRLTNCPFEAVGKKDDGLWILTIKNGTHNHEALKDISEHPSARRFNENEVLLIKEMTEAGLKPRQILKRLRQSNPELMSTPKHVYNVKAKIRQGNVTVRNFKSLRPQTSAMINDDQEVTEPSWRQRNPTVSIHVTSHEIAQGRLFPVILGLRESQLEEFHILVLSIFLELETDLQHWVLRQRVPNLIGGRFVDSQSFSSIDVINPATQLVVSQVPFTTSEEFRAAVFAAKRAFPLWRSISIASRRRIMFKFQELIHRDIDKLAMTITTEHGKPLKDAYDDVWRGLEVVEHACGLATTQIGEFAPNVSKGIDSYSVREPLGVCAGICPSEFPAMIPLWMFAIAVACGNTFVLKPSEKDPGASVILAELAMEAGLPNGVLNIVHGTNDILNYMCDHEDIKAITFSGTEAAGAYIYARASASRKRAQCNTGVKNHAVVMPDANMDATLNALVAAGFGAAGQKCMALSMAIFVGGLSRWESKLVEGAKAIKVNSGKEPNAELGPVISKQIRERICRSIQASVECGARLVLDGRDIVVPGYEQGNFIGPTILCDVRVDMDCCKDESFGPVLLCIQVESLEEAINIINRNQNSGGASIFTSSSLTARKFQAEVEVGQVGINVPVTDPLPVASFIGCRPSFVGDTGFDGKVGIHFYTQMKRVTQKWNDNVSVVESTGEGSC